MRRRGGETAGKVSMIQDGPGQQNEGSSENLAARRGNGRGHLLPRTHLLEMTMASLNSLRELFLRAVRPPLVIRALLPWR